jgi:hypothetical protein
MGTIISTATVLMHLHSLNFRMIKLISIWHNPSLVRTYQEGMYKKRNLETISFGKSEKYPLKFWF